MGGNHSFKKTAALVLSGVLTLGAVPLSPLVQDAHADTVAAEPSKVAYATKDELGADTPPLVEGVTKYTGDVTKVGRIKLGKDASGKVMEWYILGSDPGVSDGGDNIAIFAASDISNPQKFREYTTSAYPAWEGKYGTYTDGTSVSESTQLYYNHYGASDLRKTLRSMGGESDDGTKVSSNYFSDAELDMLQATTVMTQDYKNKHEDGSPAVYTTTDKLYAAWGDPKYYASVGDDYAIGGEKGHIYIGSKSGKKTEGIEITLGENFLGATTCFWLRSPLINDSYNALGARLAVDSFKVDNDRAVRPASNLNLSSVIFASAASAASSSSTGAAKTIQTSAANKDAMMLRLDGSNKNIGIVIADATSGIITATKADAAEGAVTLIVQGKNAGIDWYYTKTITSTEGETVTTENIAKALESKVTLTGTTDADKAAQIDLTKCKIWVETPVMETTSESTTATASQTLFYAVKAVDGTHTCVEKENAWGSNGESHWKICKICGQQMGDKIECTKPTAGSENEWQKNDTQHWQNCTVCDKEITSTKKDHTSEWYSGDENDHWQRCSVCGKELSSAEKHSFTWKVDEADPEKHNGTCSCGRVVEEEHTYDEHKSDATDHWYVCSKCGAEKPGSRETHKFENGKCNVEGCGYDGKHDITKREDKEEPTCTKEGHEAYWKCSQEGHEDEVFLESGTGTYVLVDAPTPIPAEGHKAGSDYVKVDTEYDAPACTVCDKPVTDKEEKHAFDDDSICTKCKYDRYEGHTYDDTVWEDDASYHWHQCTDPECPDVKASIKDKARHTFVGGKCDVCGRTRAYDDSSDDDDSSDTEYTAVDADGSWDQDERGWRFRYTNGTYAKGSVVTAADGTAELHVGWARVGGSWFAFDADGYMMQDWIYDAASGSWYYCDVNNGMQTGWLYTPVDGRWYYLDPNSGAMHIDTITPDGSRVGADGAKVSTFGT